ncbi:MAG: signal peptidase I [Pseudomonadota bacterium]
MSNNKKAVIIAETKSFAFIILIALLIRTLIVEPFFIPSSSLKDTLLVGDYLFSTKYSYGYSRYSMLFVNPTFWKGRVLAKDPEPGDIIIFRPPHAMHMRYIKRLIGMPGDKVQLINNIVYLNDKPLKREYVGEITDQDGAYKKYMETLPNGIKYNVLQLADLKGSIRDGRYSNTQVFYVPDGQYFFMGDNRDQSGDSRAELGFVPFENFIAKAQFIFFSASEYLWRDSGGVLDQISQVYYWIKSIRLHRIFRSVYAL